MEESRLPPADHHDNPADTPADVPRDAAASPPSAPSTRPVIHRFVLGPWATNCYVVAAPGDARCWIVDAGFEPEAMIEAIRALELAPQRILLTHAHLDHIAGLHAIRAAFGANLPIAIHPAEREFLIDPSLNLSLFTGMNIVAPEADETLNDGDTLELAGTGPWEVRHTPGHSPGGVTLYHAESGFAIAGDTLFQESIGRYDFPTSDGEQLIRSIRERLLTLPDETRVLPGHGDPTTIGHERLNNPFLREGVELPPV